MATEANELLHRPLTAAIDALMKDQERPKALAIGVEATADDGSREEVLVVVARGEAVAALKTFVEGMLGGGREA